MEFKVNFINKKGKKNLEQGYWKKEVIFLGMLKVLKLYLGIIKNRNEKF